MNDIVACRGGGTVVVRTWMSKSGSPASTNLNWIVAFLPFTEPTPVPLAASSDTEKV